MVAVDENESAGTVTPDAADAGTTSTELLKKYDDGIGFFAGVGRNLRTKHGESADFAHITSVSLTAELVDFSRVVARLVEIGYMGWVNDGGEELVEVPVEATLDELVAERDRLTLAILSHESLSEEDGRRVAAGMPTEAEQAAYEAEHEGDVSDEQLAVEAGAEKPKRSRKKKSAD